MTAKKVTPEQYRTMVKRETADYIRSKKPAMSGPELWSKLQKLGLSQVGFAAIIKVGPRTVRRWIADDDTVPASVAALINLTIKTGTTPDDWKF